MNLPVEILPPLEAKNRQHLLLRFEPSPLMVDRAGAAALCAMSVATYDKYARKGFLPRMNATGRVTVEAVRRACLQLDGIAEEDRLRDDPVEREVTEFRKRHGYR